MQDLFCTIRTSDTSIEDAMLTAADDDSIEGLRELGRLQAEREATETAEEKAECDAIAARLNADLDACAAALRDLPPAALRVDRARTAVTR